MQQSGCRATPVLLCARTPAKLAASQVPLHTQSSAMPEHHAMAHRLRAAAAGRPTTGVCTPSQRIQRQASWPGGRRVSPRQGFAHAAGHGRVSRSQHPRSDHHTPQRHPSTQPPARAAPGRGIITGGSGSGGGDAGAPVSPVPAMLHPSVAMCLGAAPCQPATLTCATAESQSRVMAHTQSCPALPGARRRGPLLPPLCHAAGRRRSRRPAKDRPKYWRSGAHHDSSRHPGAAMCMAGRPLPAHACNCAFV